MATIQTATCQDCGWHGPVEETKELRDVWDRVQPGDVMPAGECPVEGCAGAAMLDQEHGDADDFRTALEALMLDLDRLHRNIYAGRLRTPDRRPCQGDCRLRPQGPRQRPPAATRVQHLRRDRRPGGRLGVLGYRSAALGAAQHLRGRRHLRRLRR